MVKTRKHRSRKNRSSRRRGGGYGFGGSILGNAGGANAGNQMWNSDTSKDCSVDASRAGNGTFSGGRRRYRNVKGGSAVNNAITFSRGTNGGKRRRHRGGNQYPVKDALDVSVPRANYSFQGSGTAGIVNWAPDSY